MIKGRPRPNSTYSYVGLLHELADPLKIPDCLWVVCLVMFPLKRDEAVRMR